MTTFSSSDFFFPRYCHDEALLYEIMNTSSPSFSAVILKKARFLLV